MHRESLPSFSSALASTFFEKDPVGLELPKTMSFNVVTAPPEIKKATANSSLRPITLENDMVVQAPGFIKEGDRIVINTDTSEYVERA